MTSAINFCGLDTETDNNEEGGQAVLITLALDDLNLECERPRSWNAIWNFLKGRTYVAYNANFDIQALCHDTFIPYKKLRELARFKRTTWQGWEFHFIPSKFLTVKKKKESFTIYDLKQFYATSLAEAAKAHLGADQSKMKIPRSWYPRMVELLGKPDWRRAKIIDYARRDARIVFDLCVKLISSFEAVGVKVRKLISPASLTMEFFGPQLRKERPMGDDENSLWQRGFFGGRVEIGTMGALDDVSLYDIHSAYPAEIATLISVKDCELIEGVGKAERASRVAYGLYKLTAFVPLDFRWGPLAVRNGGKVIYPVGAVTTWCGIEGRRTLDRLVIKYEIHESHEYLKPDKPRLIFHGIEDLYASRKNPALSMAAKLMLNSLYGKLCEARRERVAEGDGYRSYRVYGRYTNYILASHITETVRMKIFNVLHNVGARAYMAATDSVLISDKEKLSIGPGLGEWDLKGHYAKAIILGCGRYILEKEDGTETMMLRGFSTSLKQIKKLKACRRPWVALPLLEGQSLLEWANGGMSGDLNVLANETRRLRLDDDKRYWPSRFPAIGRAFHDRIDSQPWVVGTLPNLERLKTLV